MKHTQGNRETVRLYRHETDGGAEYLSPIAVPGTNEGAFEGAPFIIRLDGKPEFMGPPLSVIAVALKMLEALKACEEYMTNQMSEADQMAHDMDGHDGEICILCQCRESIAKAEGR